MTTSVVEQSADESRMFGPLHFNSVEVELSSNIKHEIICLLCDNTFGLQTDFGVFVKHLFEEHHFVIEDVQHVDNLPDYLDYWRNKFKTSPMEEVIPAVKMESSNELYFLLSTLLKEDKELRHKLKLEHLLKVQEFERTDKIYRRLCLFCKLNFEGTRVEFVEHLVTKHNLQLGDPQNLVYIEELIETIDKTLENLTCIYCKRIFPERNILKEHMRKKLHKRLNRHNTDYDKYFVVNYLELKESKKMLQKQDDCPPVREEDENHNNDEEYNDWNEKEDLIVCLFCDKRETNINTLCLHMEGDHEFDFSESTSQLDFYQKVKFVNYVRRQVYNKKCVYCDLTFKSGRELQTHFFDEQHCQIPDVKLFDQPEYYFPTYENDAFLYLIDDVED